MGTVMVSVAAAASCCTCSVAAARLATMAGLSVGAAAERRTMGAGVPARLVRGPGQAAI